MTEYNSAVAEIAGFILLVLAAAAGILFQPRVWYGPTGTSGFLDFTPLVFWGLWTSLGLGIASSLLFVWTARVGVTWRSWVGVAGSLTVIVFMLVSGVPHPENWLRGRTREVGAAAFVGTELKRYRQNAERRAVERRFAGAWVAEDGTKASFHPDRTEIGREVFTPEFGRAGEEDVFEFRRAVAEPDEIRGLASARGASQDHRFICVILANGEMVVSTSSPFSENVRISRFKRP